MKTTREMWGVPPTREGLTSFFARPDIPVDEISDHTEDMEPVTIYLNQGRWVADCPVCNGGMPASPTGGFVGCSDCGSIFRTNVPEADDTYEAERILLHRPDVLNHNWERQRGEEIANLKVENVTRGLPF